MTMMRLRQELHSLNDDDRAEADRENRRDRERLSENAIEEAETVENALAAIDNRGSEYRPITNTMRCSASGIA